MKNRKNFCHLCGGVLPFGEVCFLFGTRVVCCDCADGVTVEDLMHVTGTGDPRAMLTAIGFERGVLF